jgi:hypothetical protein
MKKIVALFYLVLAGCAPTTADQLREHPSGVYSFTVAENAPAVYEQALAHALTCFRKSASGSNTTVHGDRGAGGARFSIEIENVHALTIDMLFTIDIRQTKADKTEVTVYYAQSRHEAAARAVEDWIKKDTDDCRGKGDVWCAC